MSYFPRYFALESLSNNKYLRYVHEEEVVLRGHLELSGERVISPYTKYELEPAKTEGNKGLFNIRCCYNNKYWSRKEVNARWITATAAEPVEDRFKWSCTLFQPSIQVSDNGKSTLTLSHVQNSRYVPVSIGGGDPTYQLCLKEDSNTASAAFSIIDWESFVILPEVVVFKGDNGLYMRSYGRFLIFDTSDITHFTIPHEVLYTRDGSVRLKSCFQSFWSAHSGDKGLWIGAAPGDSQIVVPDGVLDLFWLVNGHDNDEVAIRTKWGDQLCQRAQYVFDGMTNALVIGDKFMSKQTIMRVEEPVVSRSIYDVNLRLKHSRIYDRFVVLLVSKRFTNPLDVEEIIHITETFKEETIRTWKSDVSIKLATPTTIKTGVPLIVDGEVGLWDGFQGRYEWGTDMKGYQTTELSDRVTVPANSTIMVHVTATRATCDVPFSYMKRDMRTDGKVYIKMMDDGIYTGINCYNFKTQVVKIS